MASAARLGAESLRSPLAPSAQHRPPVERSWPLGAGRRRRTPPIDARSGSQRLPSQPVRVARATREARADGRRHDRSLSAEARCSPRIRLRSFGCWLASSSRRSVRGKGGSVVSSGVISATDYFTQLAVGPEAFAAIVRARNRSLEEELAIRSARVEELRRGVVWRIPGRPPRRRRRSPHRRGTRRSTRARSTPWSVMLWTRGRQTLHSARPA